MGNVNVQCRIGNTASVVEYGGLWLAILYNVKSDIFVFVFNKTDAATCLNSIYLEYGGLPLP